MPLYSVLSLCLGTRRSPAVPSEKQAFMLTSALPGDRFHNEHEVAAHLLMMLLTAEKTGPNLTHRLTAEVHTRWWFDKSVIARRLLDGLAEAIQQGAAMGEGLKRAYDFTSAAAREFVTEHPVIAGVIAVVIALGILYLTVPWIIEALGFSELGPVAESFASWWQSTYPDVPAGSVFAWLQRLGMTWGK